MTHAPVGTVFLVAVVAWAFYRRVRRNIGRQKLQPARLVLRLVILSLLTVVCLSFGISQPVLALNFAGGAFIGVFCGFLGLRHTKFDTTDNSHFYTPNTYIGVALSLLVLGRVAYRFFLLQDSTYQAGHPGAFQSPLTQFILGVTIGYYLTYYTGLFRHTRDKP